MLCTEIDAYVSLLFFYQNLYENPNIDRLPNSSFG